MVLGPTIRCPVPAGRDIEPFLPGPLSSMMGFIDGTSVRCGTSLTACPAARRRWAEPLAVGCAVASAVLVAATITVGRLTAANGSQLYEFVRSDLVIGGVFPAVGALVIVRQPWNRCGWVLISAGLLSVSALAHQWAYDGAADPGSLPGVGVATWLAAWLYMPYWLQPTLLPVLFPDGVLPSARWRRFMVAVGVVATVGTLAAMFKPDPDVEGLGLANPLGVGSTSLSPVWLAVQYGAVTLLFFVATPISIVGLLLRQRRASGRVRSQLQWLLLGFVAFLGLSLASLAAGPAEDWLSALALLMIPASIAVAVLRFGLFDVELVVNRTILYAVLTGGSVAAYLVLVGAAGSWSGGESRAPVIAAAVVTVAALLRGRLQRLIDRWLFGARRDPYEVVERVGASVAGADSPADAMGRLVSTLRDALAIPFASVEPAEADGVAFSSGRPTAEVEELPLVDRGRRVGTLFVGHRHRGEQFRPAEQAALTDVARRASALVARQP